MENPKSALGPVCEAIGVEVGDALEAVSWNGRALDEVYPWGTIRTPSPDANLATANELDSEERRAVGLRAGRFIEPFGYESFLDD